MTKVYSSVVRFFLFERTSDPALTFKTLCEGSLGMDLSQVLLKFESFRSSSITFFQVQEFLNSIFELGPVENIKQAKGNAFISFGLLFSSF